MIVTINGREETIGSSTTYEHIVALARKDPDTEPTITYYRGPTVNPEGHLLKDQSIWIREGMVFNVYDTSGA